MVWISFATEETIVDGSYFRKKLGGSCVKPEGDLLSPCFKLINFVLTKHVKDIFAVNFPKMQPIILVYSWNIIL